MFWAFLLKNWAAILMGGVVFAAAAYVETLRIEVSHDKAAIIKCKAANNTLVLAVKAQDAAIEKTAGADRVQQAAAQRAIAAAERKRPAVARSVATIAAARPGADACASADALILRSIS